MSIPAMRKAISQITGNRMPDHPGLAFSRYNSTIDEKGSYNQREKMLEYLVKKIPMTDRKPYVKAFEKWKTFLSSDQPWAVSHVLSLKDRLFIGLGNESVLEFGLSLHPTYGMPRIPGSALKGVCAHYASEIWGQIEPDWQEGKPLHKVIFGASDDIQQKLLATAGAIDFLDAWWVPADAGPFSREIINTHHQNYYAGENVPPADWDSPIPVKIAAISGSFLFAVRGPVYWNDLAMQLLKEALSTWGIGGKTRAGYGRFGVLSGALSSTTEVWDNAKIIWNAGRGGVVKAVWKDGKIATLEKKDVVEKLIPSEYHGKLFDKKKEVLVKRLEVKNIGGKNYRIEKVE